MKRTIAIIAMAAICVGGFFGLTALTGKRGPQVDVAAQVLGVPGGTTIATVNGTPISVREYGYWISFAADSIRYYTGSDLEWDADLGGVTVREVVEEQALESAKLYALMENKADELGLKLSREDKDSIAKAVSDTREQLGGEEALNTWLTYNGLSYEEFERNTAVPYHYNNLIADQTDSSPATDAEVEQYIVDHDLLRAKHILFMTVDSATGEPLEEAAAAEKKARAETVLAQLRASGDLPGAFDALMQEYSEDSGLAAYPDGYTFTANEMVAEFEAATRELACGEMSGLVKTDYGYHIILRLDPATEEVAEAVVQERVRDQMDRLVSQWMEEAVVETTESFDRFNAQDYYNAILGVRADLEAAQNSGE